jgi:hypothetical protein
LLINEVLRRNPPNKNISKSRPDKDSYLRKLYIAYATTRSKRLKHDCSLGQSTLARVLTARKDGTPEYYLSARSLGGLLDLMPTVLIDRSNFANNVKQNIKTAISNLIAPKEILNVLRERLIACIREDPGFAKKNNLVSLINKNLELCFTEIDRYEKSFRDRYGRNTKLYTRVVNDLDNRAIKEASK